jgi:RNA polymerase sigma factor (sigma-70 family)
VSVNANPSDAELLRRSSRDPDAFRLVYDRHARAVYGWLAARTGSDDLALDLTAETFAEAFRVAHRFRSGAADARPWLFGIAANVLRVTWRSQRIETRARERLGILEATRVVLDDTMDEVIARLDRQRNQDALAHALAALTVAQREAVELRIRDESSYSEIAEALGCSAGTARIRVFRGLRRLNRQLGETDASHR